VGARSRDSGAAAPPRPRLRRTAAVLVALAVVGSSGTATGLTVRTLTGRDIPAPAPVAIVAPVPALGPLAAAAPTATATGVGGVLGPLAAARGLGDFTGSVTDPATGAVLWSQDAGTPLVPGSTAKLLTTAAALLTLDPTDRLATRVVSGPDPGTVILVGGGDPTLTALPLDKTGVYPDPARLTTLADAVRKAATAPVRRVLVDTSRFTGPTLQPTWDPADVAGGFVTPIEPLMLDGGRKDPTQEDGARVDDPALTAGRALAGLLGADTGSVAEATAAPDARVLGMVTSAPISDLVEHAIRASDNVLAEVLAREVAIERNADPSFEGATAQTLLALSQAGFDTTGAQLVDGSGLSFDDKVPAQLLGAVLAQAAAPAQGARDTQFLRPILTGLPVAGGDGTLADRFASGSPSASGRGVVRAKTGTLTGVSSLAGIVTDADGRLLVFALMSNGVNPGLVRPRLDAFAAQLSRCGCR
jgi:D-alanyl-D-alanine carboxypeptidase/D-alanyl-D-alanine-endopeptidase (penicillin-binding protein 4)